MLTKLSEKQPPKFARTPYGVWERLGSLIHSLPKDAILGIHNPGTMENGFTGIAIRNVDGFEWNPARRQFTFLCDGGEFVNFSSFERYLMFDGIRGKPIRFKGIVTLDRWNGNEIEFRRLESDKEPIRMSLEKAGLWYSEDGTPYRCSEIPLWEDE